MSNVCRINNGEYEIPFNILFIQSKDIQRDSNSAPEQHLALTLSYEQEILSDFSIEVSKLANSENPISSIECIYKGKTILSSIYFNDIVLVTSDFNADYPDAQWTITLEFIHSDTNKDV